MPSKPPTLDFLKSLKLIHPYLNSASDYLIFIILMIQTFIKLNNKEVSSKISIVQKWIYLGVLGLLEKYTTNFFVGTIAVGIGKVVLIFLMSHGYEMKKWSKHENSEVYQAGQSVKYSNQTILYLYILKMLFKLATAILKKMPYSVRSKELAKNISQIKELFSPPRESIKILQKIPPEPQIPPTFGNLQAIEISKEQEKDKNEDSPQDNLTKKRTINSQQISAIIKPNTELQTLLSPNEQMLMFHFDDAHKSPMWGQFISKPDPIPEQIQQLSEDPSIMGFNCDEMIQLTRKSFEFFRQVMITKSLQGIQINVKNSPGPRRKFCPNFQINVLNQQILSLTSNQSQRFFRFQNNQTMKNFQRYVNGI